MNKKIYATILITGVSGFIGRVLARYFHKRQVRVYGIDRAAPDQAPLSDLYHYEQVNLPSSLLPQFLADWRVDAVIHCAGRASVPAAMQDPYADYVDGPVLTFELLEALRKSLPECVFLLLSSAAVYGNPQHLPIAEDAPIKPISTYGYHKWQSETICAEFSSVYGLKTACARIFSAYGPGLRRQVVWDIINKALTQPVIELQGNGWESRDFIHVSDIASGLDVILHHSPLNGDTYNLASGVGTSIEFLTSMIVKKMSFGGSIKYSDILPPGTPRNWTADIQRISNLGYKPMIGLDEGLSSYIIWAIENSSRKT